VYLAGKHFFFTEQKLEAGMTTGDPNKLSVSFSSPRPHHHHSYLIYLCVAFVVLESCFSRDKGNREKLNIKAGW